MTRNALIQNGGLIEGILGAFPVLQFFFLILRINGIKHEQNLCGCILLYPTKKAKWQMNVDPVCKYPFEEGQITKNKLVMNEGA